jgi:hypothetical protein
MNEGRQPNWVLAAVAWAASARFQQEEQVQLLLSVC